jgi:hypothetical protein
MPDDWRASTARGTGYGDGRSQSGTNFRVWKEIRLRDVGIAQTFALLALRFTYGKSCKCNYLRLRVFT